jgi:ABC-type uncharacterized transport system auxiliary subunit
MRSRWAIVSSAVLLVVAWGCGAARPSKFYTLEMPTTSAMAGPPIAADLLVSHFTAPQLLRDSRIVYRYGSTQLGTYEYHRWAEPPAAMIQALLLRTLRTSGRFRSVAPQASNASGDYLIRGRIQEFGEVSEPSLGARVVMDIELVEKASGRAVWTDFYDQTEPVNGKEVTDVVAVLNQVARRGIEQFAAGIANYFAKRPPR